MPNILLIDFGSTYTKITAVDIEQEVVLGTASGFTTVDTDITDGLNQAMERLFSQIGRIKFDQVLACSSAAGGLKMVAVGLVPELTAEAAKRAALGAGAKILGVYSGELSEYEIAEIADLKPDIILLAGGTDGGNKQVISHNAAMLANLGFDVPVVVAGNKSVAPFVVKTLAATMSEVIHVQNVMPKLNELNIEPARKAIRDVFLKRIVEAKGLNRASQIVDRMVMPTPAAVLKAAELLGSGFGKEAGLGDLMVVDIGGATTDVYSIAQGNPTQSGVALRGLPEPFAKRTVEGDLGMRYSARALADAAGTALIARYAGASEQAVAAYIDKVAEDVDYLAGDPAECSVEVGMAKACVSVSADRHVGQLETHYTITGTVFVQTGKDLTAVTTLIGTGGVIIHNDRSMDIMSGILFDEQNPLSLKPRQPQHLVDRQYILAAMGLLGEEYPEVAIRMMKKYMERGI